MSSPETSDQLTEEFKWTPHKMAQLETLLRERKHSQSQIADKLGTTANAVASKIRRTPHLKEIGGLTRRRGRSKGASNSTRPSSTRSGHLEGESKPQRNPDKHDDRNNAEKIFDGMNGVDKSEHNAITQCNYPLFEAGKHCKRPQRQRKPPYCAHHTKRSQRRGKNS